MDAENNLIIIGLCATIIGIIARKNIRKNQRNKKYKNRSIWARKWLLRREIPGRDLSSLVFDELRIEDPKAFLNFTRMRESTFDFLLQKVTPRIERLDTVFRQSISTKTRLLMTLRYLATGENFTTLSYSFRISVPAISAIIVETCTVIYEELKSDYLKTPQSKTEWQTVADDFYRQWNFPNCLGALDGKHIAFRAKKIDGSFYYNYKGFKSIVLMAVVDANYNFIYIDVGCNGRNNDSGVFIQSSLYAAINTNALDFPEDNSLPEDTSQNKFPYVFVADDAFKLTCRMLRPYGERSIKKNKIFNYRLSRARRVVENAFGILANRFQILQRDIKLDVLKVQQITLTTCVLHNFINNVEGKQSFKSTIDYENTNTCTLERGNWREEVFITGFQPINSRAKNDAIKVRNQFCDYFNGPGAVDWQDQAIQKFNF